jgi:hypothetical protein
LRTQNSVCRLLREALWFSYFENEKSGYRSLQNCFTLTGVPLHPAIFSLHAISFMWLNCCLLIILSVTNTVLWFPRILHCYVGQWRSLCVVTLTSLNQHFGELKNCTFPFVLALFAKWCPLIRVKIAHHFLYSTQFYNNPS